MTEPETQKKRKIDVESSVEQSLPSFNDTPSQKYPKLEKFHSKKSEQKDQKVVDHEAWVKARKALLEEEKNLTRHMDHVTRLRQQLPWESVSQDYVFDSSTGPIKMSALFKPSEDVRDLIVYHVMFPPSDETPCATCSQYVEGFDAYRPQIEVHRKVNIVAVGRAPIEKLDAVAKRKGWKLTVLSSLKNSFNHDYGVTSPEEEQKNKTAKFYNYGSGQYFGVPDYPGVSVFRLGPDDKIYHTYSSYGRGLDILNAGNMLLDTLPHGRQGFANVERLTHLK